ncbi:MAG TPA: ATP synthase F0 subunit B [Candidatus Mucispirillum faecigallinarum]|uniref:ATP synthase F0 subunit B n=1 Tax=Candidatus Mucispirillum faecigallinarum TaxID=2838699 RepID=A0A9D2KBA2_9BACT|nr:ATP synthase F0 subunit B [Candidatus Mucispirillum faecigallinarum]
MISIGLDETLFIQLFLLIVVIIMAKFLYLNPVKSTIEARDEKIKSLKSTADSGLKSVEESKKAYEEKLLAVRAEMSAYQIKMKEEASKEVEAIIAAAKADIAKSTEVSRKELKQSYDAARQTLQKESSEISEMIYKTISGNVA